MYKYKISVTSGNVLRKSGYRTSTGKSHVDGVHLQNTSPQVQCGYFYVFYQHMFAYLGEKKLVLHHDVYPVSPQKGNMDFRT